MRKLSVEVNPLQFPLPFIQTKKLVLTSCIAGLPISQHLHSGRTFTGVIVECGQQTKMAASAVVKPAWVLRCKKPTQITINSKMVGWW